MRLISAADDELYGLASAAGKLGRAAKLLDRLAAARNAGPPRTGSPEPASAETGATEAGPTGTGPTGTGPTGAVPAGIGVAGIGPTGFAGTGFADAEAAGRYALALMAVLPSIGVEFAAHARFTATVEAFGDVLTLDPDNWLARYSRARLRALIPSSYGAYSVQVSTEISAARDDLDHLLARQAELVPRPYFISTHALASVLDQLAGESPAAGRPALLEALNACPRVPVGFVALGAVLCEPLATLYAGATDDAERHAIGEVMSAVYGAQPAVVSMLRGQPVGR